MVVIFCCNFFLWFRSCIYRDNIGIIKDNFVEDYKFLEDYFWIRLLFILNIILVGLLIYFLVFVFGAIFVFGGEKILLCGLFDIINFCFDGYC